VARHGEQVMVELDEKSQLLLNVIQDEVAFDERPFKKLGEKIGTSEDETVKIVADLKEKRILRQISAIFDTRSLGYQSSLVAARVPEGKADEVAEIINKHPGVTHNYARRHDFVLWFTIGIPGNSDMNWHIDTLQKQSGALSIRLTARPRRWASTKRRRCTATRSGRSRSRR
jgi:DNA-binding Lrp family transcriptional regulator